MPVISWARALAALVATSALGAATSVSADSSAGVDAIVIRTASDGDGVLSLEGARITSAQRLSMVAVVSYLDRPLSLAVPGIGGTGDVDDDAVLGRAVVIDVATALSLSSRWAISFAASAYRVEVGAGYGVRGRYDAGGSQPSTGLIALRPLSNLDPSGGYEAQGLAGPLDVRVGSKVMLLDGARVALALATLVQLPFGEDEMFLGDRGVVIEPRLAVEVELSGRGRARLLGNLGARLRKRTVLESFDPATESADMSTVVLDVGSELVLGLGTGVELTRRIYAAAEVGLLAPLPASWSYGSCRRASGAPCGRIAESDYFAGKGRGDGAAFLQGGVAIHGAPGVDLIVSAATELVAARGEAVRLSAGVRWSPEPEGASGVGRGDSDGDRIPQASDGCPQDPEDKDGFADQDGCPDPDNDGDGLLDPDDTCPDQAEDRDAFEDEDGCPERDNDDDGIDDVADRCADRAEDRDEFDDEDGCPEVDNDDDGIEDGDDRCPNHAETINGVDDQDGCPDVRVVRPPSETATGIDLGDNLVDFRERSARLSDNGKRVLDQVAALLKGRRVPLRVEVHVRFAGSTVAPMAAGAQRRADRVLAERRAQAIVAYLAAQGVPRRLLSTSAMGSDRPLAAIPPGDLGQDRVLLIKPGASR